ncbi:MAG: hypothetical protein AAFX10_06745 [Pseudomonadota bacterium]
MTATRQRLLASLAAASLLVACADRSAPPSDCAYDYDGIKADEMAAIERGETVAGRLLRREATLDTLFDQERAELERFQAILASRERPVDALDLALLDNALSRLRDVERWDRDDDRSCAEDDETVSLYCALFFASIDYLGEYQHRRTAMQEVRFAIEDVSGGREFEHRLMDFNNLPETTLGDVRGVLGMARERVAARLAAQADCELEYEVAR